MAFKKAELNPEYLKKLSDELKGEIARLAVEENPNFVDLISSASINEKGDFLSEPEIYEGKYLFLGKISDRDCYLKQNDSTFLRFYRQQKSGPNLAKGDETISVRGFLNSKVSIEQFDADELVQLSILLLRLTVQNLVELKNTIEIQR